MRQRHSSTSSWTRTQIVVFAVIAIVTLYLVAWSILASTTKKAIIGKTPLQSDLQSSNVAVDLIPSPTTEKATDEEAGSMTPFVDFILSGIGRDEASRQAGRCDKDICHQQCDPICFQYPRKISECRKPPCTEPWLLYEAELEYPLFFVDMPKFSSEESRKFFLQAQPIRTDYLVQHSSCPAPQSKQPELRCALITPFDKTEKLLFSAVPFIRGNIAVIKDGFYNGIPDDSFDEHRKCAYSSNYHMIAPSKTSTVASQGHYDKLFILMMSVTGGAYFQHFIDRGLSILVQAWSMLEKDPSIKILVSPVFDHHPIVPQIYERIGLKDRLVYRSRLPITASEMYFSCVSPHYHPYVYQKARDILGIDTQYPLAKRRTIVYLSRKGFSRSVVNEEVVIEQIKKLLTQMAVDGNTQYKLEIFDHKRMSHVNHTIEFFNKEVRALVGPHGGAFYNQIFCASKTLLVEFFPYQPKPDNEFGSLRWPEAVWWPAQFMGHTYYHIPTVSPGTGNIEIDIPSLLRILRQELW